MKTHAQKTIRILALSSLSFCFLGAQAGNALKPPVPKTPEAYLVKDPVKFKMSRGPTVHFNQRPGVPLVDVVMHIGAGGRDDPDALPGLADYTASMIKLGTGRYDALEFADAIDSLGASLSINAGWDSTEVQLHVPAARLSEALALTVRALRAPKLAPAEWARLRKQFESQFLQSRSSPHAIASRARAAALYGETRYARPLSGDKTSIAAVTLADMWRFHKRLYRPDNIEIAVAGDVDIETLSFAFRDAFKRWWTPRAPLQRTAPSALTGTPERRIILVDKPGAAQSVLYATAHVPEDLSKLDAVSDVTNALLGGSFTSRLNQNLREKNQYSYGARSGFSKSARTQTFLARTDVATPVTAPALKELNFELERIRSYVEDSEALRARTYRALTFVERFATAGRAASYWGWAVEHGLSANEIRNYSKSLLSVDQSDILRQARATIDPAHMQFIVVGDLKKIEKEVRALKIAKVVVWEKDDLFR